MTPNITPPVFTLKDFRDWLEKNHDKHTKVGLIIHKTFPFHTAVQILQLCK